jgi:hypothetical protein
VLPCRLERAQRVERQPFAIQNDLSTMGAQPMRVAASLFSSRE